MSKLVYMQFLLWWSQELFCVIIFSLCLKPILCQMLKSKCKGESLSTFIIVSMFRINHLQSYQAVVHGVFFTFIKWALTPDCLQILSADHNHGNIICLDCWAFFWIWRLQLKISPLKLQIFMHSKSQVCHISNIIFHNFFFNLGLTWKKVIWIIIHCLLTNI